MTKILIKRLSREVPLPKYETNGSSGMDLAANINTDILIDPGKTAIIPTGLALSIPKGFEIQIRPRSGLAAKKKITVLNTPGTIDADYRGEIQILATWIGEDDSFTVEAGERIAQIVIAPIPSVEFIEVESAELGDTKRGTGGFGSTGRY